jgi:tRNA pseudouridine55 synthase
VAVLETGGRALGLGEVDASGQLRPQRLFTWAAALGQPVADTAKPLS